MTKITPHLKNFSKATYLFGILLASIVVFLTHYIGISFETSAQTSEGQVTVEGKIELVQNGDFNKNGEVDAGDTVALTFRIRNLTDTDHAFAKLVTGIDNNLFYDIWNLQGAASLSEENNTIGFPNLVLPAHSKQFVTVEATVKYFTEGEQRLTLTPRLLDRNGNSIGIVIPNDHADRRIGSWIGELPWWAALPIITSSPSPAPEPTPETTPTTEPSPTATPELTPSPSVEPTVEPTPAASAPAETPGEGPVTSPL